ncbi:MAG: hypothetical protein JSS29_00465 [Proteobacteria bacterium]|nr:hypothetical protein [Pseudomonadota bacterium]
MAEAPTLHAAPGITATVEHGLPVLSLRYFDAEGEFAAAAARAAGVPLPGPGHVVRSGPFIMAWRSPTETLCLAAQEAALAFIEQALADHPGGCTVELTGALSAVHLEGVRLDDVVSRLGGLAGAPAVGATARARLADVPVLVLRLETEGASLLVERPLAEHLEGWIRETLLDLA